MSFFRRLFGAASSASPSPPNASPSEPVHRTARDEYFESAHAAWVACHEDTLSTACDRIYSLLTDPSTSDDTRLRMVALAQQLGASGFQAAALARDRLIQEAPLVQQLTATAKTRLRWVTRMDPEPTVASRYEMPDAFAGMFLSAVRSALQQQPQTQVLLSGSLANTLLKWSPARIASALGTQHEVLTYPTSDLHEAIRHLTEVRDVIEREPNKPHVFVAKLIGCPWFPLSGPESATTGLFPQTSMPYTARVYLCGMWRWDLVLDTLASTSNGLTSVDFHWYIFPSVDPDLPHASLAPLARARTDAERAAILQSTSEAMLSKVREQQFNYNLRYTGTLESIAERVDKAVALASAGSDA